MPAGGGSQVGLPYGGPPGMPAGGAPSYNRGGFGGSAAGAGSGGSSVNLPYGGPPGMPPGGAGGPPAMPSQYGMPPAMPGGAPGGQPASMFGRGGPGVSVSAAQARPLAEDPEKNVLVDLGLQADPSKLDKELKQAKADLEKANANYEREVADGKRIRAESATLRERIEEQKAQIKDREDQVVAHDRVADQLRDELQQTRDEYNKQRQEIGAMAENMAARERQAARAQEDAAKIREDMQDLNRQLMELSRTKDEGWKKLNEQLTEIEHLREVINEQERMLEERRVGLISQEEVIKELRAEKEKTIKQIAALRAERDEAATNASRSAAHIAAIEEENKRLGRLLVESQGDGARAGTAQGDHTMRLAGELKDLRVEQKKLEADRERLSEQYELADRDRQKLEGKLAQIEVELQESVHGKLAAESARNVAQEALAKSEVARAKAAEESLASAKARDQAGSAGDDARRELDKLRRRVADLEKVQTVAAPAIDPAEIQREREANERKIADLAARAEQAERSLKSLEAAVDAAKTDAQKARAEAARAKASADAQAESIIDAVGSPASSLIASGELAKRAKEIYDAINDILSEMRNNMVLVQGELPNLKSDDGETIQAVTDAVEALVDSAETAKGALRGLRDLAESK
jgi:chromosome segregation ATPase